MAYLSLPFARVVNRDALLDDAVNDIVPPAPVLQPKPPVAAAPTAVALNNPVAKSLSNAGLPAEVATRWATIIVADQRSQVKAYQKTVALFPPALSHSSTQMRHEDVACFASFTRKISFYWYFYMR